MSYWFVAAVMISGMIFGSIFTWLWFHYRIQRLLEHVRDQLDQEPDQAPEDQLSVLCEYADQKFFAYDIDTMDFLAHGATLVDLLMALDQRLNRHGNYHFHADADTAQRLREEASSES